MSEQSDAYERAVRNTQSIWRKTKTSMCIGAMGFVLMIAGGVWYFVAGESFLALGGLCLMIAAYIIGATGVQPNYTDLHALSRGPGDDTE